MENAESQKLSAKETADMCRQLGAMLTAGVPLVRSMSVMINQSLKPRVKNIYSALFSGVQRGLTLSESMAQQGGFPQLLVSAFRASESSGKMDKTANEMAVHYEKEYRLSVKIKGAMFYPMFLLALTVAVVIIVFRVVLPNFLTLFEGMELPGVTKVVIGISNAISENGWLILAAIAGIVLLVFFLAKIPSVKRELDRIKIHLPVVGPLLRIIYTSRFARTLSSLYSSGLTILSALANTRSNIGNTYIDSQFDRVISEIRNGSRLSDAIEKVDGFNSKLAATISVGEESGNLDFMLSSMADSFDYESEQALEKLTSLIGPVLIVLMAVVIGFIIISVLLPILSLYDSIGGSYVSY